ncbi:MAG: phenylalanine 4-monooxygenase [Myxococcales bacterium]|nr:phenylalanine 4-monooxygenase [Myxococcales bacterium]
MAGPEEFKMAVSKSKYEAKIPNHRGEVDFSAEEDSVWKILYERQIELLPQRACNEFMDGIKILELNPCKVPQPNEVSRKLKQVSGWSLAPVKALISFKEFFELLSLRKFPAATFIRLREDLDYLKEPDIFHEIFGHCPLLTNQAFADFTQKVGEVGVSMNKEERVMLARLYWFTVEFGLIGTTAGVRIYGGGILSSKGESVYALESPVPSREPFDLLTVLRTPYRYDEMQKKYFIIDSLEKLFQLVNEDLKEVFKEAKALGVITKNDREMRSC